MSYTITKPTAPQVPILISIPHCGIAFPDELKNDFVPSMMQTPDDTDWFVDTLYDFAPAMGITMISAHFSRWVIDLNRDPKSKPLYDDGRIITGLCTTTDFHGNPIYQRNEPDQTEINRRINAYYTPYHSKIQNILDKIKKTNGKVLLWDAHSIRHHVPTIRKEVFPDMILGSVDKQSASQKFINIALDTLRRGKYDINHNEPFRGGHITRYFGKPADNQHALQLEMNKILYMNDSENQYHHEKSNKVKALLKNVFSALIDAMG